MNTLSLMEIIGIDVSRPGWSAFSDNITSSTGRQVIIFGFGCVLISWKDVVGLEWRTSRTAAPDAAKFRLIPLIERPSRKWACGIFLPRPYTTSPPRPTKSMNEHLTQIKGVSFARGFTRNLKIGEWAIGTVANCSERIIFSRKLKTMPDAAAKLSI